MLCESVVPDQMSVLTEVPSQRLFDLRTLELTLCDRVEKQARIPCSHRRDRLRYVKTAVTIERDPAQPDDVGIVSIKVCEDAAALQAKAEAARAGRHRRSHFDVNAHEKPCVRGLLTERFRTRSALPPRRFVQQFHQRIDVRRFHQMGAVRPRSRRKPKSSRKTSHVRPYSPRRRVRPPHARCHFVELFSSSPVFPPIGRR